MAKANEAKPERDDGRRALEIVHVYKDYHPVVGGIENHVKLVAEAQAAAGHRVRVLVSAAGPKGHSERIAGVEVVRSGRIAAPASTPLSPGLFVKAMRCRPDIVHLHSPYPPGELAWRLGRRHPAVMTYHSDVVKQRLLGALWAPLQRQVLARVDRVLATSPRYVESSPFLRALPGEKIRVVPLGIDLSPFLAASSKAVGAPQRSRGADDPLQIVFVGHFRYYKGLAVLLEAMAALPEAFRLRVVGSGPQAAALRQRAEALGIEPRIDWLGRVSDEALPGVYASSDLFVLPAVARSEAFGLVLVEAMASGLPCVSTELGTGTSWVNQDGVTGAVVAPDDAAALAAGIRALAADRDRLRALGEAARTRAVEVFGAKTMIARIMQVYDEVSS